MSHELARFTPLPDLFRLDPLRSMDQFLRAFDTRPGWRDEAWPRIDIRETEQSYLVQADLPGFTKDQIDIDLEHGGVTINARSEQASDTTTGKELVSERFAGRQYRHFSLPQEVDAARAEASYENGVLRLTLPKTAAGSATKLAIK